MDKDNIKEMGSPYGGTLSNKAKLAGTKELTSNPPTTEGEGGRKLSRTQKRNKRRDLCRKLRGASGYAAGEVSGGKKRPRSVLSTPSPNVQTGTIPIKIVQINLHHSKSASAILSKKIADGEVDIALIQEPWTRDGKILGLGNCKDRLFFDRSCVRPRACIFVNPKLNAVPLVDYFSPDNAVVKVINQTNGNRDDINFVSAYLPYDSKDILSKEAKDIIETCSLQGSKMVFGCDANAHHIVWGSTDCNKRGEELLEYITKYGLYIMNKGNEPTFVVVNRREVIDITLCNSACYDFIQEWKVSNEITLSDHRLITFSVTGLSLKEYSHRNPRSTNWGSYREDLQIYTGLNSGKIKNTIDLELNVDSLQRAIIDSYEQNSKISNVHSKKLVPWWTKELTDMRISCRKLFNRAKKSGLWQDYSNALTTYNEAIRDAKRDSWRKFCSDAETITETARISKILSKDNNCKLSTIKLSDGNFTDSGRDTLTEMFRVLFPGSEEVDGNEDCTNLNLRTTGIANWIIAKEVVTYDKIVWAIMSLKSFKTPGVDGIFPILLKEGIEIIAPILCRIYRASIALGHVPLAWRQTRVVFIPKPGKDNYYEAKAFRPISLTSFLLKVLEKLVALYIKNIILIEQPLSNMQFAYQPGKSTDTAIYNLSMSLERTLNAKEIALTVFLDIEGAFDKVPINTIVEALYNRGIDGTIIEWIRNLLNCRVIRSTLLGETKLVKANCGCPQGGVLSPILWCIVVDSLLNELNQPGVECIGYADDIVITVKGKFPDTISSIMSSNLKKVERWCYNSGLTVNPNKTTMVAFTNRKKVELKEIKFFGCTLSCSEEVKYLGIYFDKKLTWKKQLDYCISRAKKIFWSCRNAIGRSWGLNPLMIKWIYSMIICPIITYGAVAWWSRTKLDTVKTELTKFQRLICVTMTGCLRSTPTATLVLLLGLCPLHLKVEAEAIFCVHRLKRNNQWKEYSNYLSWKDLNNDVIKHPTFVMRSDNMITKVGYQKQFRIMFPDRNEWQNNCLSVMSNQLVWYTDGSKMDTGTGAGVCCPEMGIKFSFSLGKYATVFQAEIFAILMCCNICMDNSYKNKKIFICSDSRAAIFALQKFEINSCIVWDCYSALCKLASAHTVTLCWVPGHSGVEGNELADELARNGSQTPFFGPEPVLGISIKHLRNTVDEILKQKQCKDWVKTTGQRQSKILNRMYASNRHIELMKLKRNGLRRAIGILTGHCTLKRHLTILGVMDDPSCRGCSYHEESIIHILCECEVFSPYRFEHLGRHVIDPWEVQDMPVRALLNFASATGLF